MENQIRDLVHTVKSSDLTATQIKNGFGEIFLSRDTLENQLETQEIVEMTRSVKVPYYGKHIPGSALIEEMPGSAGLVKMTTVPANRTYKILACSVDNAGNVANVRVGLTDTSASFLACVFAGDVAAQDVTPIPELVGVTFDQESIPAFLATSGTPDDLTFTLAYCEIIQ